MASSSVKETICKLLSWRYFLPTIILDGMPRNVRTYDHFCLTARALERVGDRWSLLVIRDLLTAPKRFTDLMDRLGGITPKTLSQRLSELDGAGILTADRQAGRREV